MTVPACLLAICTFRCEKHGPCKPPTLPDCAAAWSQDTGHSWGATFSLMFAVTLSVGGLSEAEPLEAAKVCGHCEHMCC